MMHSEYSIKGESMQRDIDNTISYVQNKNVSLEDSLYKLYFDFLNESTQKSKGTKEFYARKIAAIKVSQIKKNEGNFRDICMVAESDYYSEANLLFPELFAYRFPRPKILHLRSSTCSLE